MPGAANGGWPSVSPTRHSGRRPARVGLGWSGRWDSTSVTHLRSKPLGGHLAGIDDSWTGSRTVSFTAGLPLLAIAWQGGEGVQVDADGAAPVWHAASDQGVAAGGEVWASLYVGVATEPDGASTTALHLRRRGFEELWETSREWLDRRALPVAAVHAPTGPTGTTGPTAPTAALDERVNTNLFFNYFFAQGDCLDTGRSVLVTSRSRQYYVAAAFWSRDAFCWTFPALLLTDRARARQALVASLDAIGGRAADHALYLNGTPLYPGFELDQAAAPVIAVWRYVRLTGDTGVLDEPAVRAAVDALGPTVEPVAPPGPRALRDLPAPDRRSHRPPLRHHGQRPPGGGVRGPGLTPRGGWRDECPGEAAADSPGSTARSGRRRPGPAHPRPAGREPDGRWPLRADVGVGVRCRGIDRVP